MEVSFYKLKGVIKMTDFYRKLSKDVVVGDILYLDAGDFVSADGRILETIIYK